MKCEANLGSGLFRGQGLLTHNVSLAKRLGCLGTLDFLPVKWGLE